MIDNGAIKCFDARTCQGDIAKPALVVVVDVDLSLVVKRRSVARTDDDDEVFDHASKRHHRRRDVSERRLDKRDAQNFVHAGEKTSPEAESPSGVDQGSNRGLHVQQVPQPPREPSLLCL